MPLKIQNWKQEIEQLVRDPKVAIRYTKVSEVNGYGFYVSIIPPGEANTGHYHPKEPELYHIAKGKGVLLSLPIEQHDAGKPAERQDVEEGMSAAIPGRVIHRLVNTGKEPLIFFFECTTAHMDKGSPLRTVIDNFGGPMEKILAGR